MPRSGRACWSASAEGSATRGPGAALWRRPSSRDPSAVAPSVAAARPGGSSSSRGPELPASWQSVRGAPEGRHLPSVPYLTASCRRPPPDPLRSIAVARRRVPEHSRTGAPFGSPLPLLDMPGRPRRRCPGLTAVAQQVGCTHSEAGRPGPLFPGSLRPMACSGRSQDTGSARTTCPTFAAVLSVAWTAFSAGSPRRPPLPASGVPS
mmetsp:Transcript_420/g.1560  ORF Transcript_420/g.1560 Transcript_420/m.1560 type:complete len:207 (+) Transcript_420:1368-1988(+)